MAQDHVTQPVRKQWRVASVQHAPPRSDADDGNFNRPHSGDSVRPANHFDVVDDPLATSVWRGSFDASLVHSGTACDCNDCASCDSAYLAALADRGCRNWIAVDYLYWKTSGGDLPPLIRSTPGALPNQTGLLSQAGNTLFGGDSQDVRQSGIRVGGGWWFDDCHSRGVEVFYMGLPESSDGVRFDSAFFSHLGRPVFDTVLNAESAMLVAHPDFMTGHVTIDQSFRFHHIEALRRDLLVDNSCRRIDSLVGLRYASLEDSLLITQSSTYTVAQGQILAGSRRDLVDRFEASNRFQGIVLGLDYTETIGLLNLHARGTLGLGNNRAEVLIDGQTVNTVPNDVPDSFAGGLLAQTTNIGTHTKNRFAVMPELFLGVSVRFSYGWEAKAGYQLIYWSDAVQSANQVDRRVSQFPPEPPADINAPSVLMNRGGVLLHGLQTGLTLNF